jgi:hypothetical protein
MYLHSWAALVRRRWAIPQHQKCPFQQHLMVPRRKKQRAKAQKIVEHRSTLKRNPLLLNHLRQ